MISGNGQDFAFQNVADNSQRAFFRSWRLFLAMHNRAVLDHDKFVTLLVSVGTSLKHGIVGRCSGDDYRLAAHRSEGVVQVAVGETAQVALGPASQVLFVCFY